MPCLFPDLEFLAECEQRDHMGFGDFSVEEEFRIDVRIVFLEQQQRVVDETDHFFHRLLVEAELEIKFFDFKAVLEEEATVVDWPCSHVRGRPLELVG